MNTDSSLDGHTKLILGWALGLGSAFVIEVYKKWIQKKQFREAVTSEIEEFKVTLTGTLISLKMSTGTLTRAELEKCKDLQLKYAIDAESVNKSANALLSIDPKDFPNAIKAYARERDGNIQVVPPLSLPYLTANPALISLLEATDQRILVRTLSVLERANGQIEDMDYWHRESFKSGQNSNFDLTVKNYYSSREALILSIGRLLSLIESFEKRRSGAHKIPTLSNYLIQG